MVLLKNETNSELYTCDFITNLYSNIDPSEIIVKIINIEHK